MQEKGPLKSRKASRFLRGQATVEYSIVTHILMLGGAATIWVFTGVLYNALNAYYDSIYFVLQSSVP